jgi:anti-sigma factor RsiW
MRSRRPQRPPAQCLKLVDRLSGYIDHELTTTQRRAIDLHCRDCSRCRRMIATLRRTVALCRQAGSAPLPGRAQTRARAAVARLLAGRK